MALKNKSRGEISLAYQQTLASDSFPKYEPYIMQSADFDKEPVESWMANQAEMDNADSDVENDVENDTENDTDENTEYDIETRPQKCCSA